jgi:hypothetical protein
VVTRANDQKKIAAALAHLPPEFPRPSFMFHEAPAWALRLKKIFGARWYYFLWQKTLRSKIVRWQNEDRYDLYHHLTFASYRYATAFEQSSAKHIWGPVGGAEMVPAGLLPALISKAGVYERLRNRMIERDRRFPCALRKRAVLNAKILASTIETQRLF